MDKDFFQLLRRIQKEERNKATLARVEKDFYKKLYSFIRDLERSVANDPFGNDQLLLANAQRIATEICQWRESKISKAANNNIYRSFHLFKKENPQFDLLDTTPLNLTDEEETLYFSLMDALKTHRYNISMDKFVDDGDGEMGYADEESEDEDDYGTSMQSRVNTGVVSEDEFFNDGDSSKDSKIVSGESAVESVSDGFSGEPIPDESVSEHASVDESVADVSAEESVSDVSAVGESGSEVSSVEETSQEDNVKESNLETGTIKSDSNLNESDEVLNRLKQINNSTVIEDEKYEPIESQINNQAKVVPNVSMENNLRIGKKKPGKVNSIESKQANSKPAEDRPQRKSSSTLDFDSIFSNPDSQFDNVDQFEHNYEDDFASIEAGSVFAEPSDADLMFGARPKAKAKKESNIQPETKVENSNVQLEPKVGAPNVQESDAQLEPKIESSNAPLEKPSSQVQAKPKSNPIYTLAKKEELKSTAVVISNDMGAIVGIDQKIYGPFAAKDVVVLPNIMAQVLIDNNKAELIDI